MGPAGGSSSRTPGQHHLPPPARQPRSTPGGMQCGSFFLQRDPCCECEIGRGSGGDCLIETPVSTPLPDERAQRGRTAPSLPTLLSKLPDCEHPHRRNHSVAAPL